jgi:glutamine amidotransferase
MRILIADYGVGNLHSIAKGLERAGAEVEVANQIGLLGGAECVVFPGVGAFGAAMDQLRPILTSLRSRIMSGMPTLGICLGMQILFEKSEESPGEGIGVLEGDVKRLNALRVPQMGWNDVLWNDDPMFDGVSKGSQFYFANSYICRPSGNVVIAETDYGERFPAAVRRRNIFGVQFHPEKSGLPGLRLLSNFVKMAEESR